jgi:hypothetical protein
VNDFGGKYENKGEDYIYDTRVLVDAVDYLIELMFKYKVDLLANISMA